MAGFPSSEARHPQSSHGGGVDVELLADPPPATSCHVALDIPEPVHKSDDRTVVVEEDNCCLITTFKGVYVWAIVFSSYLFIRCVATTKMTWDEALVAVMVAAVSVFAFFAVAFAYRADEQEWKARVERSKN